jgi:hypothetical protein
MYIHGIYYVVYTMHIPGIFLVYHNLHCIYMVYIRYIHGIFQSYVDVLHNYIYLVYTQSTTNEFVLYLFFFKWYNFDIPSICLKYLLNIIKVQLSQPKMRNQSNVRSQTEECSVNVNAVSTRCPRGVHAVSMCVRMADDGAVCRWLSFMQNEASSRYIFLQFGHRDRAIIESDDVLLWPSRLC